MLRLQARALQIETAQLRRAAKRVNNLPRLDRFFRAFVLKMNAFSSRAFFNAKKICSVKNFHPALLQSRSQRVCKIAIHLLQDLPSPLQHRDTRAKSREIMRK